MKTLFVILLIMLAFFIGFIVGFFYDIIIIYGVPNESIDNSTDVMRAMFRAIH